MEGWQKSSSDDCKPILALMHIQCMCIYIYTYKCNIYIYIYAYVYINMYTSISIYMYIYWIQAGIAHFMPCTKALLP